MYAKLSRLTKFTRIKDKFHNNIVNSFKSFISTEINQIRILNSLFMTHANTLQKQINLNRMNLFDVYK